MKPRGNNGMSPKLAQVMGEKGRDNGHSGTLNDRKALKAQALELLARGHSPYAVALHMGIPARTVRRWAR